MSKQNTNTTLCARTEDPTAVKKIVSSTNALKASHERMLSYTTSLMDATSTGDWARVDLLKKCLQDEATYLGQLAHGISTATAEVAQ